MLRKSIIIFVLLVSLIGIVAASASAVSAGPSLSNKKSGNGGYIVTFEQGSRPASDSSSIIMPMSSTGSIRQGETQWRTRVVSQYMTSVIIDLYWGNPSNSLRMRIYTPDGYVLGPYYDNADGWLDGNIRAIISNGNGVAQGTYYIEIYGDRVNGVQSYTVY